MPSTPAGSAGAGSPPGSYIRAGGGVDVHGRRVVAIATLSCAVLLAALSVGLAVGAAHHNARADALRHGVPVRVTVTGCLAISSGVGMGIEYWQCRGSYRVAGQTYNEVIGGSRRFLDAGQSVGGLVSAAHPAEVATAASVGDGRAGWESFFVPAMLGVVAVALAAGWLVLSGRFRSRRGVAGGA